MTSGFVNGLGSPWAPRGMSQVVGHNHFDALLFGPSNHEDRRSRLRAWDSNGYALGIWSYEGIILFPQSWNAALGVKWQIVWGYLAGSTFFGGGFRNKSSSSKLRDNNNCSILASSSAPMLHFFKSSSLILFPATWIGAKDSLKHAY